VRVYGFLYRQLTLIGADYANFKANLGPVPIFCMLADRHEWRFYILDFNTTPFNIRRFSKVIQLTAEEGTIDFLVGLKEGEPCL
jgi:hypothetical protein